MQAHSLPPALAKQVAIKGDEVADDLAEKPRQNWRPADDAVYSVEPQKDKTICVLT